MKKMTTTLLALATSIALVAILAGMSNTSTSQPTSSLKYSEAKLQPAKIIAIKFHADWCGYCKAMGPVFEELQAKFDMEPVLYVEFDQTRDFGRGQSAYLAGALGLEKVWKEHGGKTGFVLLIDARTMEVVERLNHEQNLKQMGAALKEAVRSAS